MTIKLYYSFRNPNRYPVTIDCSNLPSQTKQSHKSECDINNILKQFSKTGIISHINQNSQTYINLPDAIDYQQSLNIISEASGAFASLPSKVRDHYMNDPGSFLLALSDPSEAEFLRECGILKKPPLPVASPAASPAAEPPPAASKTAGVS